MSEPNVDFGRPTIFFDSHPEEQEGYLYSCWSTLKATLHIAFTGIVPKYHGPGTLRIIWYTHDGNQGMKDYGLHEYAQVRENFDVLLDLEEVRRVIIRGYSGQNPYLYGGDGSGIGEKIEKEKREKGEKARREKQKEIFDDEEEGRNGKEVNIEELIERHDKAEEERKREAEERIWKENEGLLSGGMV